MNVNNLNVEGSKIVWKQKGLKDLRHQKSIGMHKDTNTNKGALTNPRDSRCNI